MTSKIKSLEYVRKCLQEIGYEEEKIAESYPIIVEDKIVYFDFVAFGHSRVHDTSTSCITVKYCNNNDEENQAVNYTKYSASPILIVPKKEKVNIWKIESKDKFNKIQVLKYDELGEYFSKNRVKFNSDKIVSSKQDQEQLTFFNAGELFEFATKINCRLLGDDFKNAVNNGKKLISPSNEDQVMDLTSITMHIIAAKILNDKLLLGKLYTDIDEILDIVSNQYSDYFDKNQLYKYGEELIREIYQAFRKDISYRSIDNRILGSFYENTLFEEDDRKNKKIKRELGIYYTPTSIVTNMLRTMPIEFINYKERFVLDGSCGSGSMLIGAYKRLKDLLPKKMKDEVKHKYLTDMIYGIDIDRFACEVARLELLLMSIPYGNGWNIKNSDFTITNSMNRNPNIIVANPPYEEKRSGKLYEKATAFLDKYIDFLEQDGLLGIVMPESFLENKSGKETRLKLLKNIQINEIWSLPKGLFDTNNCATIVIIGKKVQEDYIEDMPLKIRIVNKNDYSIERFKTLGLFDFDFIYKSQKEFLNNDDYKITFSPLDSIIEKIENNDRIKNYVDYTQGLRIPFKYNYPLLSEEYLDGYSKFFRSAKEGFNRYEINWSKQRKTKYIKYDPKNEINKQFMGKENDKGLRLFENKRHILEGQKVIFNMNSTPGTFWRTKAAIDREGIYPSHSFWCFIPKDECISLEVIVSLLNSKIINMYLGNKNRALNIKSNTILNIPVPKFTDIDKVNLKKYILEIEKDKNNESLYQQKIDMIINKAFNLSDNEIELIEIYYKMFNNESNNAFNKFNDETIVEETIEVTGSVVGVNKDDNKLLVKFIECDEEKYVEIDHEIPGWLLKKDTSFVCKLNEDDFYDEEICIKNVRALDFTYLSEEEAGNLITNNFNDYGAPKVKQDDIFLQGGA